MKLTKDVSIAKGRKRKARRKVTKRLRVTRVQTYTLDPELDKIIHMECSFSERLTALDKHLGIFK